MVDVKKKMRSKEKKKNIFNRTINAFSITTETIGVVSAAENEVNVHVCGL